MVIHLPKVAQRFLRALAPVPLLLAPFLVSADTDTNVVLRFNDGDTIAGELVTFSSSEYQMVTSVGTILVPADDVQCIAAACPTTATRGEVGLTSLDGTSAITGILIAVSAAEFVVSTAIGDIRVARDSVVCSGPSCPDAETPNADRVVTMIGPGVRVEGVLVGYDDRAFIVTTEFGNANFSKLEFDCEGLGCPD